MFKTLFFVVLIILVLNGLCGLGFVPWTFNLDVLGHGYGHGFFELLGGVIGLIIAAALISFVLTIVGMIGFFVLGVVLLAALFGGGIALVALLPLLLVVGVIALLSPIGS